MRQAGLVTVTTVARRPCGLPSARIYPSILAAATEQALQMRVAEFLWPFLMGSVTWPSCSRKEGKMSTGKRRERRLNLRLTEEELSVIRHAATSSRMRPGTFAREMLVKTSGRRVRRSRGRLPPVGRR